MPRPSILTTYLTLLLLRTLFSKGRMRLLSLLSKLVIGKLDHPQPTTLTNLVSTHSVAMIDLHAYPPSSGGCALVSALLIP